MPQGLPHTSTDSHLTMRRSSTTALQIATPHRNFIYVILVCLFVYLILYIYVLPSNVILDNQYARGVNNSLVEERVDHKYSVVASECSKVTSSCYQVIDKKEEVENGELVERHMIVKGFEEDSDTVVRLIPPKGKTFEDSDTRMWKVDHLTVQSQYIAALIAAPFIVSSFSLVDQDNDGKSILEIGLGGGSFDMFLHQLNPKINITAIELDPTVVSLSQSWFGVVEDETRSTVVADGLKYINEISEKSLKYNAIVLDACDSSTVVPCPSEIFRKPDVYEKLSKAITVNALNATPPRFETGRLVIGTSRVLVVNILSYGDDDTNESGKIIEALTEHFNTCMRVTLKDEINIIAICTRQSFSETEGNIEFLKRRAIAVTMRLGLQDVLNKISVIS